MSEYQYFEFLAIDRAFKIKSYLIVFIRFTFFLNEFFTLFL